MWDRIEDTEATIAELEGMLVEDPKNKVLKEDLASRRELRQLYARAVPDYKPRPSRRHARQQAKLRAFTSTNSHPLANRIERVAPGDK